MFGHVLAYLRDGVVAAGYECDVRMLGRLKREFDFCCLDLLEEHELVLAAGGRGYGVLKSVAAYDRRTDSWTESTPVLEARKDFGMSVIAGEVYISGGHSAMYLQMASVERYSPLSNTWSSVAAMPTAIYGHGACSVNGCMYVLGGHDGQDYLQRVLKYDTGSDSWSEVATMPAARAWAAAVDSDIYVIGGENIDGGRV